jgi:NTE family protein
MAAREHSTVSDEASNVDLVFEGGGMKGIGLVGALSILEQRGYRVQNLAGTSAGSIVATLYAAGYTAGELRALLRDLDFTQFLDRAWEDRIPLAGTPLSIVKDEGIYEGERFLAWIGDRLAEKGVHTFGDLVHPDYADDELRYRYKAQVIASDVTNHRLLVLPRDAGRLGIEPDDLNVAMAVRMSMSIPIFFEPVRFRNPRTGQEHLIVDGGLLSNYPVWIFDSDGIPAWPTFGLQLVEPEPEKSLGDRLEPLPPHRDGIESVVDYVKSLVQTMMEAHDRLYVEQANFARTIPIPTLGVRTTEFTLAAERAEALFEAGRTAAETFLETWDFAGYIAAFRSGRVRSRRRDVAEDVRLAVAS